MADSRTIVLIYLIGFLIGASIFLPIILVYLILWRKHSCHGWTVVATVTSYLCWYLSFATVMALKTSGSYAISTLAVVRVLLQFTYVSSHCWTLVLAYHIWKSLRATSPLTSDSRQDLRQFLLYCSVGYGVPVCVTGISLAVISSMSTGKGFAPDVAYYLYAYRCWFFYPAVGIVFLVSLGLLLSTLKWLREFRKSRSTRRRSGARTSQTSAVLVCKLMILMGATLIIDVFLSILSTMELGGSISLAVIEVVDHIFHAGCMFWIFLWNRDIREQLAGKFPRWFPAPARTVSEFSSVPAASQISRGV